MRLPFVSFRVRLRLLLGAAGLVLVAVGVAMAVLPAPAEARTADAANPFTSSASKAAVIHFVPLDARAGALLSATVPNVKRYLHNPYEITAIPSRPSSWVNQQRRQLNGRAVMADLMARFRRAQGGRQAFLVIVTSDSLYDPGFLEYGFVFGSRASAAEGKTPAAVAIGTAQMRVYYPEREKARLTKMMLRYIGEVVCRLPRNGDPKSVLYSPILSDADLDRMRAALPSRC